MALKPTKYGRCAYSKKALNKDGRCPEQNMRCVCDVEPMSRIDEINKLKQLREDALLSLKHLRSKCISVCIPNTSNEVNVKVMAYIKELEQRAGIKI